MVIVNLGLSIVLFALLQAWLKANTNRHWIYWFAFGMGLMLYSAIPQFGFVIRGDPIYVGHTKGYEITILDIAALAYILHKRSEKRDFQIPFRNLMLAYLGVTILSVVFSVFREATAYYVFQLLRMYLVYKAITLSTLTESNYFSFLKGLAAGMAIQALIVFYQRFGMGDIQPDGTFGHQNLLGFVSNVVLTTSMAAILSGDKPISRWVSALAGLATSALTGSRGSVGFAFVGLAGTYFHSLFHGVSGRKMQIGLAGAVVTAILLPIAIAQLAARFDIERQIFGDNTEVYDERGAYVEATTMMFADHPLGVGANNFVLAANVGGYYDAAKVLATHGSRSGHVHNIYYLTAGELGIQGLVALLALMIYPIWRGLSYVLKHRGNKEAEFLGGITVALAICWAHSWVEWIIITADSQYFISMLLALLGSRLILLEELASSDIQSTQPGTGSSSIRAPLQQEVSPAGFRVQAPLVTIPPPTEPPKKRHYPRPGQRPPPPPKPPSDF